MSRSRQSKQNSNLDDRYSMTEKKKVRREDQDIATERLYSEGRSRSARRENQKK